MPKYFAYGSNMCQKRLIDRIGSFTIVGIAVLGGHDLKFNKRSVDGSGKANIVPAPTRHVEGALFELSEGQLDSLDKHEKGYRRETVHVMCDTKIVEAITYVAKATQVGLRPTSDYLLFIRDGAAECGLSAQYQSRLADVIE